MNHIILYGDHMSLPRTARNYLRIQRLNSENGDEEDGGDGISGGDDIIGCDDINCDDTRAHQRNSDLASEFQLLAASWILKIKDSCKLTQSTMEEVMQK